MARKKADLLRRITKSHLEAIGRVAATWSLLELMILSAISQASGIRTDKIIKLAGPSAFAAWVTMLLGFAKESEEHKHKFDELERLCKLLKKLQNRRNFIIHAAWQIPKRNGSGLINSEMPRDPTITDQSQALGIMKRGEQSLFRVAWTPKQMRQVAQSIESARIMLLEIQMRPKPASKKEYLSQSRQSQRNLRRIGLMLDSLPDPSRK